MPNVKAQALNEAQIPNRGAFHIESFDIILTFGF
jgi:hypothetical protein